jgi:hypothetical protein
MWQLLDHVMNHSTRHRAAAAALLTAAGRSPGDLDLLDFAEKLAGPQPGAGPQPEAMPPPEAGPQPEAG